MSEQAEQTDSPINHASIAEAALEKLQNEVREAARSTERRIKKADAQGFFGWRAQVG